MASYTTSEKIRIIRRVLEDGETKSFVAATEGCERHSLDNWIRKYQENGELGLISQKRGVSKYTIEYRDEVLKYFSEHHTSISYLSKRFNIPVSTVKGWIHDAKKKNKLIDRQPEEFNTNALLDQLIKENQRLRMENDVLKKASASIL